MKLDIKLAAFFLPLLLLTGCGEDRRVSTSQPAPYHPAVRTTLPTATAVGTADDPLLSEGNAVASDPLLSNGNSSADPLQQGDPLQGRKMPTDHSHWLRGSILGARLTVQLNGVRQGVYTGLVDKDITMRLRKGINTVTFVYEPRQSDANAQMNLVESEHHPPIAPLVTFRSDPPASDAPLKPTTQTFTFFAK